MEDEVDNPETTIEELVEVSLDENNSKKKVKVGALLTKEELTEFLRKIKIYLLGSIKT